ncbi:hypothetical protein [Fibrobacter sp.]|uniref:carboxypeptidase-like regulatory domain-containing protein n=1 Tax=Fibrobacter sp. TaxID=35828 RepID=UPI00388FB13B
MNILKQIFPIAIIVAFLTSCSDTSDDSSVNASDQEGTEQTSDNEAKDKSKAKDSDKNTPSKNCDEDNKSTDSDINSKSDDTTANDNDSDETDNDHGYIGFISDLNIDLPTGGIVRTWSPTADGLELISTDTLDSDGKYKIDPSLEGFHLIDMRSEDISATRWIYFEKNMKTAIYVAHAHVSVTGVIRNNNVGIEGATVRILDRESKTKSDGTFEIEGLPDGVHFMTVEYGGESRIYQVQVSRTVHFMEEQITNQIEWSNGIYTLLTDYENWPTGRTVPGNMFGNVGSCYFSTDSQNGGNSKFKGTEQFAHEERFVQDSIMGTCMYLGVDIDENTENHYAFAGFILGADARENKDNNYSFFDISKASGLSFEAKGTGNLSLQLEVRNSEGNKENIALEAIELTDEWATYTYAFDDISSMLTAAESVNFIVTSDADIYIDNVRLDGLSPILWPSLGRKF